MSWKRRQAEYVKNDIHLGGEVGSNERGDSLSKGNPRSSSPGNKIGWKLIFLCRFTNLQIVKNVTIRPLRPLGPPTAIFSTQVTNT